MAFIQEIDLGICIRLGIWKVEETPIDFDYLGEIYTSVLQKYRNPKRQLEVLCTNALLRKMTNNADLRVVHNQAGKPFCVDKQTAKQIEEGTNNSEECSKSLRISISHTLGWVAIIVSNERDVSVDIEYISDRVARIAHKFIRHDEPFVQIKQQLVCWCAKETVYKYFSEQDLHFDEMRLHDFVCDDEGEIMIDNLRTGLLVKAHYIVNNDYALTWIC